MSQNKATVRVFFGVAPSFSPLATLRRNFTTIGRSPTDDAESIAMTERRIPSSTYRRGMRVNGTVVGGRKKKEEQMTKL